MTLRHFKIFVAVCDTMNMTSAAKELFISQSAISQAIAELEIHYDTKLFERLSRKLYLTQAGHKLLSYARHIIQMNVDVENDMKTLNKNGRIRIGASVTVGAYVLPNLVLQFKKISPQTEITVFEDNTEKIESLLLNDQIDIALVEGETTSADILNQPFMDDELTLICGTNHRFSNLPFVEPYDLEQEDFIIREKGSGTRKTFEDQMTANGLEWKAAWICNNADTIKIVVAQGLGVSVISQLSVKDEVSSGKLVEKVIKGIAFRRRFKIIYHKNKYLTQPMKCFTDLCLKYRLD